MTTANEPVDPPWLAQWKATASARPTDPLRTPGGTFAPGVSGNPAGMTKGTKHTRTQLAETLKENGAALLQVAIDKALAGDSSTLALCLSRLVPVLRPKTERVQFALDRSLPLSEQAQQVVAAIADGELDPDTGKLIIDCITAAAGLKSIDEFEERLQRLEASTASRAVRGGIVEQRMQ